MSLLSSFLDKSVVLKRAAVVKDAIGASTRTFPTTVASFRAGIWPTRSDIARTFGRRDLLGDNIIVSDADRGAKAGDIVEHGDLVYLVHGGQLFSCAAVGATQVYLIDATLRTV